jgi:hypothetical protein
MIQEALKFHLFFVMTPDPKAQNRKQLCCFLVFVNRPGFGYGVSCDCKIK